MNVQIAGREYTTFVNGPGCRSVIFFSGCSHGCEGCHNKDLWPYSYGKTYEVSDIVNDIKKYYDAKLIQGVTISGGEPFDQPLALEELVNELRRNGIQDIWVYTGYTFEEALSKSNFVVSLLHVLVDGKFDINQRDETCKYKGSRNQRVIDCNATLTKAVRLATTGENSHDYIKLYNSED